MKKASLDGDRPKRGVCYVRVSTERQVFIGNSLKAQQRKLEQWAKAHDIPIAAVYSDEGLSGGRADNRPGLQAAIDDVCKNGGVLIVYSLTRLARCVTDTLTISERLEKTGADLVSLSESIDTTSAAGKMVFRLLAVLAEFERDLVSERTREAHCYRRANGLASSHPPFGWDKVTVNEGGRLVKRLVENEEEQKTLQKIWQLRDQGKSLRQIADYLNRRGIKQKHGTKGWRHSQIGRLFKRSQMIELEARKTPSGLEATNPKSEEPE